MKISPINELMPEYREIKPAALKEKQIGIEKQNDIEDRDYYDYEPETCNMSAQSIYDLFGDMGH